MLKVLSIGMGQCGNNIAALASEHGFDAIAFNSSEKDLESANNGKTNLIIQPIKDTEENGQKDGCGKSREKSREIMHSKLQAYIKGYIERIKKYDIVFIQSSTGGGMGSGSAISLAALIKLHTNVKVALIGVLPKLTEDNISKKNTNNYMVDYVTVKKKFGNIVLPIALIDNNKVESDSTRDVHNLINNKIIELFKFYRGDYTNDIAKESVLDDEDRLSSLSVDGVLCFNSYNFPKESSSIDFDSILLDIIKSSYFAYQPSGVLSHLLTVYNTDIKCDVKKEKILNEFGEEDFSKNHIVSEYNEDIPNLCCLLAGLRLPKERMNMGIKKINEFEKKKIEAREADELLVLNKFDDISNINRNAQFIDNDNKSSEDMSNELKNSFDKLFS